MNKKHIILLALQLVTLVSFMAVLGIVMCFVLNVLSSSSVVFDDIFLFHCIVFFNSLLAVYQQYKPKFKKGISKK